MHFTAAYKNLSLKCFYIYVILHKYFHTSHNSRSFTSVAFKYSGFLPFLRSTLSPQAYRNHLSVSEQVKCTRVYSDY